MQRSENGGSTPMPSVKLNLPPHVVCGPKRADGTCSVMFRVRRGRPQGWPSTIPLPRSSPRTGDLTNADELARIIADAAKLDHELTAARAGGEPNTYPEGSLPSVAARWQKRWDADGLGERTKEFYRKGLRKLAVWSAIERHRHIRGLTLPAIIKYLRTYDDRPAQRAALRRTLSALLSFAMVEGIISAHPLGVTPRLARRKTPKRKVTLWMAVDVETYAQMAIARGWAGGARMLRLMWQTSADATDVITWRRDKHFRDGPQPAISYTRGKTGEEPPPVPISRSLAEDLRTCGEIFFVTDPTGRPYVADNIHSDNQRGGHFRALREAVADAGGKRLVLDHLRHSAVTDAIEKGANLAHIPSLTAHRGTEMIEQVYAQMSNAQIQAVQKARGIAE